MLRKQNLATLSLCCVLLCTVALAARAQAPIPSQVAVGPLTIGVRVGAGVSWMSFSQDDLVAPFAGDITGQVVLADSRRFGGTGGISVSYEVAQRWALEARVLLASQGSTVRGTNELQASGLEDEVLFGTVTTIFKARYLYVPVLARAAFGAPMGRFYVGAGPSFGFLMSAKVGDAIRLNVQGTNLRAEFSSETDIKDDMTSTVTNLSFLGGWETGGSRLRGFFEVGYDIGMTDLFSSEFGLEPVKHRGLTFTGGLGF